ncbi:hypothetical protein V6Z11_A03G038700 [Gossypium hirsutum]
MERQASSLSHSPSLRYTWHTRAHAGFVGLLNQAGFCCQSIFGDFHLIYNIYMLHI